MTHLKEGDFIYIKIWRFCYEAVEAQLYSVWNSKILNSILTLLPCLFSKEKNKKRGTDFPPLNTQCLRFGQRVEYCLHTRYTLPAIRRILQNMKNNLIYFVAMFFIFIFLNKIRSFEPSFCIMQSMHDHNLKNSLKLNLLQKTFELKYVAQ